MRSKSATGADAKENPSLFQREKLSSRVSSPFNIRYVPGCAAGAIAGALTTPPFTLLWQSCAASINSCASCKQLHGAVGVRGFAGADKFLGFEQVLGEFAAGVLVPEKLGVVKALGEFADDLIFVFGDRSGFGLSPSLARRAPSRRRPPSPPVARGRRQAAIALRTVRARWPPE